MLGTYDPDLPLPSVGRQPIPARVASAAPAAYLKRRYRKLACQRSRNSAEFDSWRVQPYRPTIPDYSRETPFHEIVRCLGDCRCPTRPRCWTVGRNEIADAVGRIFARLFLVN